MIGQPAVVNDIPAPPPELSVRLRGGSMRFLEAALAIIAIVTAILLDHLR